MVGVVLLVRSLLPGSLWAMAGEIVVGAVVYAVMLESFFLPGHLARVAGLVRGSIPALGS